MWGQTSKYTHTHKQTILMTINFYTLLGDRDFNNIHATLVHDDMTEIYWDHGHNRLYDDSRKTVLSLLVSFILVNY